MFTPPRLTAITRRRSLLAPLLIQGLLFAVVLADHPLAAAVLGSCVIAVMAILLAMADGRIAGAWAERDSALTRVRALEIELAEANTDPVTGLAVRRLAERYLTDAVGLALTVAVADVDGMLAVNNGHSHQFGDAYLAGIAHRLQDAAVDGDVVARLGGDEFVLITIRTPVPVAQAMAVATRDPLTIGGTHIPIRLSIGLCTTTGGDTHFGFGCADLAMFAAKRRRSGIEHYDPVRDGVPQPRGHRPRLRFRDHHRSDTT